MDGRLIVIAVALVFLWMVVQGSSSRRRRTVYVAPAFRMTVTPERAGELAQQRTRLAIDAESAALARGEQSEVLYSRRVRALSRAAVDETDPGDPFDRG